MSPALNYGIQAFEGIKAFRTPANRIAIFRPDQNASRLAHSSSMVSIPPVPPAQFHKCLHLAVSLNAEFVPPASSGAALYIRPLAFGSSPQLGLNPPEEYTFVVFVMPTGVYHGVHPVDALLLEEFDRAAPEGTGSAKVGGNYAPVLRWSERAKQEGFGITLHLDSKTRTEIDEFSTSGFVGVRQDADGKVTLCVPNSKSVLKSVTSDSVQILAESFGWTVERRSVKYDELASFSEILAAGTAAALVPIKSITVRSRGDKFVYQGGGEEPGPVCVKLLTVLKGIQNGKVEDSFGWLDYVEDERDFLKKRELNGTNGTNGAVESVDRLD